MTPSQTTEYTAVLGDLIQEVAPFMPIEHVLGVLLRSYELATPATLEDPDIGTRMGTIARNHGIVLDAARTRRSRATEAELIAAVPPEWTSPAGISRRLGYLNTASAGRHHGTVLLAVGKTRDTPTGMDTMTIRDALAVIASRDPRIEEEQTIRQKKVREWAQDEHGRFVPADSLVDEAVFRYRRKS